MELKIKLYDGIMPKKQHDGDAAFDVFVPCDTILKAGRQIVDLGFAIELPHGYAAIIQPRSGFSSKGMETRLKKADGDELPFRIDADVIVGLVDENYRGHVGAIVSVWYPIEKNETVTLKKGTRIAQMRIVAVPEFELKEVSELSSTDRNGGFGSTGA